jgi:serine/threonine protein kinase/Flp pilus assembly protein TadD
MTSPNDRDDDMLRTTLGSGPKGPQPDPESGEIVAARQKIEALFDLLRRPVAAGEAHAGDELTPGNMLGEYTILRPLASGGMGQVYLARQESLNRLVALKVCRPEIAGDPRMKSRFLAEAHSLAQLSHPNVVPVLSTGEDSGYLYLAMEYVAGPNLARVLQAIGGASPDSLASTVAAEVLSSPDGHEQSRPWGEGHARLDRAYQTWVVQTLQQVAQGLAAVHKAGILHRDIKPANIVFAANGVPKIVDFGLARIARVPSTTVMGEFYGTPAYASPEQARGDVEEVSPASDVFSLGTTLFECLSLDRPFPGRTSMDVLNAVLNSEAPLLRQAEKRVPWELEAITDKCLRKNPGERYPSGQALADDLRNYLELRPVSARPASKIGRAARRIRRQPWAAAFILALVGAAILGVVLAERAWADYRAERIRAFAKQVDEGDAALFRCLTGKRTTWLPAIIEQYRQQGIDAYTAALQYDSTAIRPLVQRARFYASKAETLDLALADLDKAQRVQPGFASIRKFRGYVLDELGRKEEGQDARQGATSLDATTADDLYWLGVIAHAREQDFFACYTYFSRALLLAPNDYWSRLERAYFGRIISEDGIATRKRVIPELEVAKTIRPDLPFASELLVGFYSTDPVYSLDSRQKNELADQIERFGLDIPRAWDMATLLQKEKKFDEAEAILGKVLDQDPGGRTAEQMGHLEYRRGHYDRARDWYRRAIDEGANYPVAYMEFANACTATKDWQAAERAYLDGIAEHPKDAFLYWNLGSWYEQRGRAADAVKTYRKGCDLPCDFKGSSQSLAESSGQIRDIALCYQSLARLSGQLGRPTDRIRVLERAVAQLEEALVSANQALKQSVEDRISGLKGDLGQAYVSAGRRKDALSFIDTELKKRPFRALNARSLIDLLTLLGMQQGALEVARLAEFTTQQDAPSHDRSSRQLARTIVDGQLRQLGLFKELRDRLETRRALGDQLRDMDYRWLGTIYQGTEALAILGEGVKKYPDSVGLHSDYMQSLANAGRKEEAWRAYEEGRDLYFAKVAGRQAPVFPGDLPLKPESLLSPADVAGPWYSYLLQEERAEEFQRLENRLLEACATTRNRPEELAFPRASAEFATHKYAAAVKSLEICLKGKLGNEALVTGALARSLRALGRRQEAIDLYRRAVRLSDVDPGLLSEFLYLVVQVHGVDGLLRELPAYEQTWLRLNVRPNATLDCFSAWAALATGDEKRAFEKLVLAGPFFLQTSREPVFVGDEGLACAIIIQIVSEKLADSKRLAEATEFLKRFPADRIRAMREVFLLPKRS